MTLSELFVELPGFLQVRLEQGLEKTPIPADATQEEVYRAILFLVQDIESEYDDLTGREANTLRAIPDAFVKTLF